jgi:pre-mRNA-processing factor SLU7
MASSKPSFKSRDEFLKARDLEEARKAGRAPAEVDAEGNEINPHIPAFLANAPWYLAQGPGLKHQRKDVDPAAAPMPFDARPRIERVALERPVKFKRGSCENCGATTHKKRDCVERPRRVMAKHSGKDLKAGEIVLDKVGNGAAAAGAGGAAAAPLLGSIVLPGAGKRDREGAYAAKRDRWDGYDPAEHALTQRRFRMAEMERLRHRASALDAEEKKKAGDASSAAASAGAAAGAGDDFREKGDEALIQKRDDRSRQTVRTLRIREDTAKYLRNLDVNSAYYDAKTRSMREDPNPEDPDSVYRGDNFVRAGGEADEYRRLTAFAWDAAARGETVHPQAIPSQAELSFKEFKTKKDDLADRRRREVLERYGGAEHLDSLPAELRLAQTEHYEEYSRDGRVVAGGAPGAPGSAPARAAPTRAGVPSKYNEDIFVNNHTAVWGSWWCKGRWGYGCCASEIRNSYCTGEAGKRAREAAERGPLVPQADELSAGCGG